MFKHLKEIVNIDEAIPGPGFFQEAKGYSDSGEFTDEFYDIMTQVTKMKKVMKNPKWIEYMKATDRNMDTNTEGSARDAISAIQDLENALTDIDREFDRANGLDSPAPSKGGMASEIPDDSDDDQDK